MSFDAVWMSPHKLLWWVPELAVEMTISLLNLHCRPSWVSVHPAVIGSLDLNLILSSMRNSWAAIRISLDDTLKTTEVIFLANKFSAFPVIEFSKNAHVLCSWCPLHKGEIIIFLQLKTKLIVRSSNIFDTSFSRLEDIQPSIFLKFKEYNNKLNMTYFLNSFCLKWRSFLNSSRYGSSCNTCGLPSGLWIKPSGSPANSSFLDTVFCFGPSKSWALNSSWSVDLLDAWADVFS